MANHQYWRAVNLDSYAGGALELSEFHLLSAGVRVDASATLTSNVAPSAGALANLQDDDTSTFASWTQSEIKGLVLKWDFGGSPVDVHDIRLGAVKDIVKFLLGARIQFSDDGITWSASSAGSGFKWPGPNQKTTSTTGRMGNDRSFDKVYSLLHFDGADATTTFEDSTGLTWTANGNAQIDTAQSVFGTGSLLVDGTGDWVDTPAGLALGAQDFCIELRVRFAAVGATRQIIAGQSGSAGTNDTVSFILEKNASNRFEAVCCFGTGTIGQVLASNTAVLANTWYNVAYVRRAGVFRLFINGTQEGSAPTSSDPVNTSTANLAIGRLGEYPLLSMNGWVDEFRITVGSARYSANYTIAVEPHPEGGGIDRNTVVGRASPQEVSLVASDGAAYPYSGAKEIARYRARPDYILGGLGRVSGTVKEAGTPEVPVRRRVRLIREQDGMLVREQWSNPTTGAYDFQYVQTDCTYTVLSYDHFGNYRAVVADRLEPELMP